jgi:predicted acylesterase/phospholipase RssA
MLYKKLILSGGGIKAISFIGSLRVLDLYGILSHIETFLGCSAGSIVTLLIVLGYTPQQLHQLFLNINFSNYHDIQLNNILTRKGLDSGNKLMKLLTIICQRKGLTPNTTFIELYQKHKKELIIVGSNITHNKANYFSHTLTPNMPVLTAVRISISYPYIFEPIQWNGCLYVDGGLLDPFSIKYFGRECQDVLGILIHDRLQTENRNNSNDSIEDYSLSILSAIVDRMTELAMEGMEGRFIHIDIKNIHSMNFNQSNEDKLQLYQLGIKKTHAFFQRYYLVRKYFFNWKKKVEYRVSHLPCISDKNCP